jgi:hypothetical protein
MKQIREFSSRFRLIWSLAALAVLLGALAITPVRASTICENECWGWNNIQGCVDCHWCCSYDDGHYTCSGRTGNRDCGTGG